MTKKIANRCNLYECACAQRLAIVPGTAFEEVALTITSGNILYSLTALSGDLSTYSGLLKPHGSRRCLQ
eukprot:1265162-Alexandrium_andersonii.AAC.1